MRPPRPDWLFKAAESPTVVDIAAYITYLEQQLESCQAAYNNLCRDSSELAERLADRAVD